MSSTDKSSKKRTKTPDMSSTDKPSKKSTKTPDVSSTDKPPKNGSDKTVNSPNNKLDNNTSDKPHKSSLKYTGHSSRRTAGNCSENIAKNSSTVNAADLATYDNSNSSADANALNMSANTTSTSSGKSLALFLSVDVSSKLLRVMETRTDDYMQRQYIMCCSRRSGKRHRHSQGSSSCHRAEVVQAQEGRNPAEKAWPSSC